MSKASSQARQQYDYDQRIKRDQEFEQQMRDSQREVALGLPELKRQNAKLAKEFADAEWKEYVRKEKIRLMNEPSPEWHATVTRYSGTDTPETVCKRMQAAYAEFKRLARHWENSDNELLMSFMSANADACNACELDTWLSAWQYVTQRLTRPEPESEVQPVTHTEIAEPKNPNPYDSHPNSAYQVWDRQKAESEHFAVVAPEFRTPIIEIQQALQQATGGSWEVSSALMADVYTLVTRRDPRFSPPDRQHIRRAFHFLQAHNYQNVDAAFEGDEKRVWLCDKSPDATLAEDFAALAGAANPRFRGRAGAPTRNL